MSKSFFYVPRLHYVHVLSLLKTEYKYLIHGLRIGQSRQLL